MAEGDCTSVRRHVTAPSRRRALRSTDRLHEQGEPSGAAPIGVDTSASAGLRHKRGRPAHGPRPAFVLRRNSTTARQETRFARIPQPTRRPRRRGPGPGRLGRAHRAKEGSRRRAGDTRGGVRSERGSGTTDDRAVGSRLHRSRRRRDRIALQPATPPTLTPPRRLGPVGRDEVNYGVEPLFQAACAACDLSEQQSAF